MPEKSISGFLGAMTVKYLIPEGWWEYRHYNPDDVYNCCLDDIVIGWMPLPKASMDED